MKYHMVDRIEDAVEFEALREDWNDLLQSSAANCLFLTWEWLHTWWKHLAEDRRLFILTVRSGRELLALAPFAIRAGSLTSVHPFRSLEFLGSGNVGSDYLDLIIRRGHEKEVVSALADYLNYENWTLTLSQLKRGSSFAVELAQLLVKRDWRLSEARTNACPFINLSGHNWQSYLATLGSQHRYNLQRRLKNLTRQDDMRFEQVLSDEQRQQALALLIDLHNLRWSERGGSDAFHTAGLRSFHEEFSRIALRAGWLRLFVLWLDGKPASALYGFLYQRNFSFYQSGFDPSYGKQSVGLVTMGLAIRNAIEEGADEYDLLHGEEQYKSLWAHETRELGRLELYPPNVRGRLYERTVVLNRVARRMARHVLSTPRTLGQLWAHEN